MSIYLFAHVNASAGNNVPSVLRGLIFPINTWNTQVFAPKARNTWLCVSVCAREFCKHLVRASSLAPCPDRWVAASELKGDSQGWPGSCKPLHASSVYLRAFVCTAQCSSGWLQLLSTPLDTPEQQPNSFFLPLGTKLERALNYFFKQSDLTTHLRGGHIFIQI